MAENLMAKMADSVLGHSDQDRATNIDISDPDREGHKYADESGEKMKALIWMGKNDVRIGLFAYSSTCMSIYLLTCQSVETSKPRIIENHDAIVRVTGTTICGSDVYIMHVAILQVEKGDILGHEFCGVIEAVGPAVTKFSPGDRVVNSFVVLCGECEFCKQNLTTACEKTNVLTVHEKLYGLWMGGIFGYSYFIGGYAGGQAEFVRVPLADNNLLRLPHSVLDEKGLFVY
jgi:hypothetical protein